jgi:hypothetical protein
MCNCPTCVARMDREFWAIIAANYDVAACYQLAWTPTILLPVQK